PKKSKLNNDGYCKDAIRDVSQDNPGGSGCTAYCELRLTKKFGQEVPVTSGTCGEETDCSIAKGETVTYTSTYEINVGVSDDSLADILKASFTAGASWSFSKSISYSTTAARKKKLETNECGYWTFIPFIIESCGTLTTADKETKTWGQYNENSKTTCNKKKMHNVENYCNLTPYLDGNGATDGTVVFVYTDCGTGKLLPADKQEPEYRYPGVSTNTGDV
ncbi:hypothetical protein BCR34DRAFT_493308, partial [Clohesyomyces aquaticus]